jgi:hypothetical protein
LRESSSWRARSARLRDRAGIRRRWAGSGLRSRDVRYGLFFRFFLEWTSQVLTLPVAPQHASRASNITTFGLVVSSGLLPSLFKRWRAMLAPVIPLPITTTSAVVGKSLVDRWPRSNGEGSECQKDLLEFGVGSPAGCPSLGRSGIVRAMIEN